MINLWDSVKSNNVTLPKEKLKIKVASRQQDSITYKESYVEYELKTHYCTKEDLAIFGDELGKYINSEVYSKYLCLDDNQAIGLTQTSLMEYSNLIVYYDYDDCLKDRLSASCLSTVSTVGNRQWLDFAYTY
jgi:hypothetical protein